MVVSILWRDTHDKVERRDTHCGISTVEGYS